MELASQPKNRFVSQEAPPLYTACLDPTIGEFGSSRHSASTLKGSKLQI